MPFDLYDYVDEQNVNVNVISEWAKGLQTRQRAQVQAKIDLLSLGGTELFPGTLTGSDVAGILRLRVKGNVQLRPCLCKGPLHPEMETAFTLLAGAHEKGGKMLPKGVVETAAARKEKVKADPAARRSKHVGFEKKVD